MKENLFRGTAAALIALAGLGLTGCGNGLVPVSGKVTRKGEPLEGWTVTFYPTDAAKGRPALASTDASGVFRAATAPDGDGMAPGEYRIAVQPALAVADEKSRAAKARAGAALGSVPRHYLKPETSGLTVSVAPGERAKHLDLDLKD